MEDKEEANWIYYEDGHTFYCLLHVKKRVEEINKNREFSDDIDYPGGDRCGYYQDTAFLEEEVECCKCDAPLYSLIDD